MAQHLGRKFSRGFTLIESLVAFVVVVVMVATGLVALSSAAHGFTKQAKTIRSQTTIDRLEDQLTASAHTSLSVFTPSSCGADPHGDNDACTSVRFYNKDSAGAVHIWGWEYAAGTLKECLSYPNADGACTTFGNSTAVSKFNVVPTPATSLQLTTTLGVAPVDKENEVSDAVTDPNGRMVSGNRVAIVSFADQTSLREVHLLQGGATFSTAVVHGDLAPPALGNLSTGISPSNNLTFIDKNATACSYASGTITPDCVITVTETGYANYQTYFAGPYWSTNASTACPAILTTSTISGGGDSETYRITPVAPGTCTFQVQTHDQTANVTVTVYAIPTYTSAIESIAHPYVIDHTVNAGDSIMGVTTLTPAPPGTSYPPGTPATAQVGISSLTNQGTVVTNNTPGWNSSGTTFTFTGLNYGTTSGVLSVNPPAANAVIVNQNQAFTFNVYDPAAYQITVSTTLINVMVGQAATWTGRSNITNSVQAGVSAGVAAATLPVFYNNGTGNCTFPTVGNMASPATFSATPQSATTCTAQVQDTNGDAPQTVRINGSWPSFNPGTPSATATSPTGIFLNSSPPSGGSGAGYSVLFTIIGGPSFIGASCQVSYSCTAQPLVSGATYTFSTRYYDSAGDTVAGANVSATTPYPGFNAGGPGCSGDSSTTIICNSSPPSGGSGTGYYVVYYITAGPDHINVPCGPAGYACQFTGLTPSTSYGITAWYYDSIGDSAPAGAGAVTQAPPGPTGLIEEQEVENFAPFGGNVGVIYEWNDGETCDTFTSTCSGPDGTSASLMSVLPTGMACGGSYVSYPLAGALSAFYLNESEQNFGVVSYLNTVNGPFNAFAGYDASWVLDNYCPGYSGK